MKNLLYLSFFGLISCIDKPEIATTEEAIEPMVEEVAKDTISKPKYSFIVIVTDEPVDLANDIIRRETKQYTTAIDTIPRPVDEDYQYKQLDLAEDNLRHCELDSIQTAYKAQVKIVRRNFYVFDTYKEASIARQEFLQKN